MKQMLLYEDPQTGGPVAVIFASIEARDAFEDATPNVLAIGTAPVVTARQAAADHKAAR